MKIKDYLEIIGEPNSLFGKELKILEPHFHIIDEFKYLSVEVIEDINMINESVEMSTDGSISIRSITDPELVTTKYFDNLKQTILLYGVFLKDGEVFIRCTKSSLIRNN